MPLIHSKSPAAFKTNVRTLMGEVGKSPHVQSRQQALAIAYATKRRGKQDGGATSMPPWMNRLIAHARPMINQGDTPPVRRQLRGFTQLSNNVEDLRDAGLARQMLHFLRSHPVGQMLANRNQQEGDPSGPLAQQAGVDDIGKQGGGGTPPMPWFARQEARNLTHGMLHSPVPGRTDKLPISVGGGAYVLPADHVSHIGQNNSMAGAAVLNKMFNMTPAGQSPQRAMGQRTRLPFAKLSARGGAHDSHGVPIVAAGGEFIIPPEKIKEKFGDVDHGHKVLDAWVNSTRKKHIETLRKLKPPKKS